MENNNQSDDKTALKNQILNSLKAQYSLVNAQFQGMLKNKFQGTDKFKYYGSVMIGGLLAIPLKLVPGSAASDLTSMSLNRSIKKQAESILDELNQLKQPESLFENCAEDLLGTYHKQLTLLLHKMSEDNKKKIHLPYYLARSIFSNFLEAKKVLFDDDFLKVTLFNNGDVNLEKQFRTIFYLSLLFIKKPAFFYLDQNADLFHDYIARAGFAIEGKYYTDLQRRLPAELHGFRQWKSTIGGDFSVLHRLSHCINGSLKPRSLKPEERKKYTDISELADSELADIDCLILQEGKSLIIDIDFLSKKRGGKRLNEHEEKLLLESICSISAIAEYMEMEEDNLLNDPFCFDFNKNTFEDKLQQFKQAMYKEIAQLFEDEEPQVNESNSCYSSLP